MTDRVVEVLVQPNVAVDVIVTEATKVVEVELGIQGPQGPQGPQGSQGPQGLPGTTEDPGDLVSVFEANLF